MKKLMLGSLLLLPITTWAGDIGGGQSFQLDHQTVEILKDQPTTIDQYRKWLDLMTDQQLEDTLKKTFKKHIQPQIKN